MRKLDCAILGGFLGAFAAPLLFSPLEHAFRAQADGAAVGLWFPWVSMFVGSPVGIVVGAGLGAWLGTSEPRRPTREETGREE